MTISHATELRNVYMHTYAAFATSPSDVVESVDGVDNIRFARELLATLVDANLVAVADVNGEEDAWQTFPDTYDTMTNEEAEARIDNWLGTAQPETKKDKTMTKKPDTFHACLCGCGENVPSKSFYRPGHDARHAGVIGRQIAANFNTKGFDRRELLNALPSERLVAKAEGIAEKQIAKIEAKAVREVEKANKPAKAEPKVEQGIITVGKNEFVAQRFPDGKVTYFKGDEEKVASKTASATFVVE